MKIVIIGQWFFPQLTPRAFRCFELAKQFGRMGYEVIVYALTGGYNYSELENQYGFKVIDMGDSQLGLKNSLGNWNKNLFWRLIRKLIRNYDVFPGIEFFLKIRKVLRQENSIDMLITVAHPHVIHWATSRFINRAKVKLWIADCGDPYMGNPFVRHSKVFEKVERKWNEKCDYITVPVVEAISAYYKEYRNKIRVIPQGFDFEGIQKLPYKKNEVTTFIYAGTCYKDLRDPEAFLTYLSSLNNDFRFVVYTKNKQFFLPYKEKLGEKLEVKSYIPRNELIQEMSKSEFLINLVNSSGVQQPSKLIDYLYADRPIINISSLFLPEERQHFNEYMVGDYSSYIVPDDISKYDIKIVANQFLSLY